MNINASTQQAPFRNAPHKKWRVLLVSTTEQYSQFRQYRLLHTSPWLSATNAKAQNRPKNWRRPPLKWLVWGGSDIRQILRALHSISEIIGRIRGRGRITTATHRIKLTILTVYPVHSAPNRAGPPARQCSATEMDRNFQEEVIEPSGTEWASLIVCAPKKDCTPLFFMDYVKLNLVTIRNWYLLHRMDDCIYSLCDASIFSTLDAN